ncbi:MAG: hypothetical protein ACOYID_06440 [Eubacteriales bacterium]|jgi:hypothetical protein|nr:hypothetical protein [Clostridiales bacterium]
MKKIINWFKNYWYYYKWRTLIIGFFVICAIVMVPQVITKVDYDIHILYAGPYIFQLGEKEQAEEIFRGLMERDYNGDGQKTVILANMTIMTDEQLKEAMEAAYKRTGPTVILNQYSIAQMDRAFSQEIFAGESVICLLDPSKYEQVKTQNGFLPLVEALGYKPEIAFDDYGMYLKDTEVGQYFELFRKMPEDTILCIRRLSTASIFTGAKKAQQSYEYHLDYFKRLVEFVAE